jgi:hypothetical protein
MPTPGSRTGAVELFFEGANQTEPASGQPCLAVVLEIDRSDRNIYGAWREFHDVIHMSHVKTFNRPSPTTWCVIR